MPATRRRNLVFALIAAGVLVVAGAVALVLALSQSAPTTVPTPTASATTATVAPSESSTPTPTPTVTAEAGGELALGAEGFELTADGETVSFRWADDPTEAVAALTTAIGSEPVEDLQEGDGSHFPDYTVWSWPGLEFGSMVETPDGKPRSEYNAPAWVRFSANEVGGVDVIAEFDLAIGMSVDEVRAAGPDEEFASPYEDGPRFIFADDRSFTSEDDPQPQQVSVIVDADDDDGVVTIAYQYASKL